VIDVDTAKSLGAGRPGEICLRGPTTMLGYLNRPKETAEAIDKEGWYKTGDFGHIDQEGFIYITGRITEMIRVDGKPIPPTEWERVIRSHPKVADCAVVAIHHKEKGHLPKAFVVAADAALTENDVLDLVSERLPAAMYLRGGVSFVREIPKSPAGKVLRLSLLERKSPDA
ncbi:putative 4-coumarate--CoA ligase 1-like protein, partial [Aphelenchoides avenae]